MKNLISQGTRSKFMQIGSLIVVITLLMIYSCGSSAEPQGEDARIESESVETLAPIPDYDEAEPVEEVPSINSPEQIDEFSRDEIEKMANSGETDENIIPELNFWDKVSQDGSFAAFQKALKAAKNDEDRWKIADKYPEIAERSGMIDALSPRKDTAQVKSQR